MPLLRNLSEDEMQALLHKIKNSSRKSEDSISSDLYGDMVFKTVEEKLS